MGPGLRLALVIINVCEQLCASRGLRTSSQKKGRKGRREGGGKKKKSPDL